VTSHLRALVFGLAAACMPLAWAEPFVFPAYRSAAQIDEECQRLLADQKQTEQHLTDWPVDRAATLLPELDAMQRRYEDTLLPLELLAAVHPDKAFRDASEACTVAYQAFGSAFLQNAGIHALLKQVQPEDDIDRRLLADQLDTFEDSGVALAPDVQARAREINVEMTRLAVDFERRVREDKTRVAFTAPELAGVPRQVWQRATRDSPGRYLLGLDSPTAVPVIEGARLAATRMRMWRAYQNQGGEENLKTLAQLGQLRREYARLFGFESYADFLLRRRMARTEAQALSFLADVKSAVAQRELADLAVLRAAKAKDLRKAASATVLQRWDVAYYTERVRQERFKVRQDQFRAHFPPEASLKFVFKLAETLFGVQFKPLRQSLWHADARAYEVTDGTSQAMLGTLFVDLYPRDDKYGHAAVWPLRNVSTLAQRGPAAALVVNFNRQGLSIEELETLLHEFGHALHVLLSTTRYALQGGFNVVHEFSEAPSQMLEDWVYDAEVLKLFGQVCKDCKPVPAALIARAERARQFGKGIAVSRQHLFASYDLALTGKEAPEPLAQWVQMEGATPLAHVSGTMFPAGFTHLASGYAAGYYGYLWSLVLAEDLRTGFADRRLDAATGRRYRDSVLAHGGEVAAEELMQQFLGRPTDSGAFFDALNRQ
jgi:thimet oligopeptidase